jgi:hypothetical protein
MTKNDFIEMARKSGFEIGMVTRSVYARSPSCQSKLKRFADLVAAAEREICAKVCEEHWYNNGNAMECADAIRARSQA